ncbi:hypothetical protein ABT340_39435 [Streptosporangium sp. NPDC000239]|uniref:hypothetical protein n=1 Tax=Streptosporangium sp. NPDC000239 TaxID=3154248 RepID=UPI00331726E6
MDEEVSATVVSFGEGFGHGVAVEGGHVRCGLTGEAEGGFLVVPYHYRVVWA